MFVSIGDRKVGPDYPPFIVSELGINHSGSINDCLKMMSLSRLSGAEAIKMQKRSPEHCVPKKMWRIKRDTPWGEMKYIDYKKRMEFGKEEYDAIETASKELGLIWFASVWDLRSLEFMKQYNPPCYKIGSASLTDYKLIEAVERTEMPIILSTGMSSMEEIDGTMTLLKNSHDRLILNHSISIYPCPTEKLNLRFIHRLRQRYRQLVIGYSGHEQGTGLTQIAVAYGASYIERHFTLDRYSWGTDQRASLEHWQFKSMADDCHKSWIALGNGVKVVYPEEEQKKKTMVKV